jgi:hypothetical protein
MSKILRRPLFRGGPVSSYGTGIASGLADGGRVGYYNGGKTITGADLLGLVQTYPELNMYKDQKFNPKSNYLIGGDSYRKNIIDRIASFQGTPGAQDMAFLLPGDSYDLSQTLENISETEDDNTKIASISENLPDGTKVKKEEIDIQDDYTFIPEETKKANEFKTPTMIMKEKELSGEIDSTPSKEALEIAGITEDPGEEPVTQETDLGITEMADEYFELMGGKKAKIQDASDYALKLFEETIGKGKGIKEAAGAVAGFALSKPSRTEALKNWATKTAIVRKGQMDDLEKRIASTESIADKQLLAAQWKQLNSQGQWEKKINTILRDKYDGDESKRKQATMDALGQPSTFGAALMAYEKAFGLGMKPSQLVFEDMVSEYYDPAPENWEGNENVSGTYYVPGSMVVVIIEKGKLKNQKDYSK